MDFNSVSQRWGSAGSCSYHHVRGAEALLPFAVPVGIAPHRLGDVQHSRECPASLWNAGDLRAVLARQLTLEFSCASHHDGIFLPASQPSTDSAPPMVFSFVSQGTEHLASLSLLQPFYNHISPTPFQH